MEQIAERNWPADEIVRRKVADLVPYARNARTHSDAQVGQIAASIVEWGWTNPVLVDESDGIIAGHGRILAAHKLNIDEVPTIVAKGWTEAQKRAYIIADNQLPMGADWDMELLKVELQELDGFEFDTGLLGFDDDFLANLLHDESEGLTDPDYVPEPPDEPETQPGDIWALGHHRVICGDATDATTVERLLAGVTPHLMVTDPPYGVQYDATWRERYDKFERHSTDKVTNDDRADWGEAYALFPGDVAYVWHGALHAQLVALGLGECGFNIRSQIIWVKQHFAMSRGDYHWMHEPCWYAVKKNAKGHWTGDRKQTTVWEIANKNPMGGAQDDANTTHATQKPVECMRRPIENNSSPGQAVYDPFVGSGTTIIAGEVTGRHVYAIEINPAYVDVAVRRWEEFTGESAQLERAGDSEEAGHG